MARSAQGARVPLCPSPEYVFTAVLLDFGEGGLIVTRKQILKKRHNLTLFINYPSVKTDGPSVKCSGAPLFPGGFNGGFEG